MVDYIRDGRRRLTPIGEMPILSGMLFCADCGAKLYQARVSELEAAIAEAREQRLNVDSFLGMVRRYTDITELTAEIIRSFVEKIEVKKPEKVPGTRTKKQTLVIWWNFIGVVDIPRNKSKKKRHSLHDRKLCRILFEHPSSLSECGLRRVFL